jgi:hypothetical protein
MSGSDPETRRDKPLARAVLSTLADAMGSLGRAEQATAIRQRAALMEQEVKPKEWELLGLVFHDKGVVCRHIATEIHCFDGEFMKLS